MKKNKPTPIKIALENIDTLCNLLFGEPTEIRENGEHRYAYSLKSGSESGRGSLCMNLETLRWYSHADKRGGYLKKDLLAFVAYGLNTDQKTAATWLANNIESLTDDK